jgi:hypothetical protein
VIVNIISTDKCKYWWPKYNNNPEILANAMGSDFYKKVRDSILEKGIVNPLMGIQEGEFVRVKLGNNRLIAARELGIDEVPMIMLNNEDEWKIHKRNYDFQPGDIEYERVD